MKYHLIQISHLHFPEFLVFFAISRLCRKLPELEMTLKDVIKIKSKVKTGDPGRNPKSSTFSQLILTSRNFFDTQ